MLEGEQMDVDKFGSPPSHQILLSILRMLPPPPPVKATPLSKLQRA